MCHRVRRIDIRVLSGLVVVYTRKKRPTLVTLFCALASIELLNLWNDFRKVVEFIDENKWVKPMLERIVKDKNRGMR